MNDRALGVMLGQLTGDALGTTVEFADPSAIRAKFPDGLRDIVGGGPFRVLPGQVTDDSELALALARCLVASGWDLDARARAYAAWFNSGPFDVGNTTIAAFSGWPANVTATDMLARTMERNGGPSKQANGALMRISPLAIYGARLPTPELLARAREDALFSHPSPLCQEANAAFVAAIQVGLAGGAPKEGLAAARAASDDDAIGTALEELGAQPKCHGSGQGWVMVAFKNAFHHLVHAKSFEAALIDTVMAGGDTDTNACIAGALLGAFHGASAIPKRWIDRVLACRTNRGPTYQTHDAIELAAALAGQGQMPA